jgi:hypothetical protein
LIFSVVIDLIKSLLPSILLALFGLLLLRKLEEIKTNVARHSDFSQKWAALFFDAANAFMSSAEYILSRLIFLVSSKGLVSAKFSLSHAAISAPQLLDSEAFLGSV